MTYEITPATPVTDQVLGMIAAMPTEDIPKVVDPRFMKNLSDEQFMRIATLMAKIGYDEGGCPIGGVIIDNESRQIMGKGHNSLMQTGNPTEHGETVATKDAGRVALLHGKKFVNFSKATMFTTLTPCDVCCSQISWRGGFNRVVIGDIINAPSSAGIIQAASPETKVEILEDPKAIAQYKEYSEKHPDKHFSDWLGNEFWEQHKHLPPEEVTDAAVAITKQRRQGFAAAYSAGASSRIGPRSAQGGPSTQEDGGRTTA